MNDNENDNLIQPPNPNSCFTELTVILKADERSYRQRFDLYDLYTLHHNDPVIQQCVQEAKKSFQGNPESISIKVKFEVL